MNIFATTAARMPKPAQESGQEEEYAFVALCGRIASSQHPYDPDHGGDPPVRPPQHLHLQLERRSVLRETLIMGSDVRVIA